LFLYIQINKIPHSQLGFRHDVKNFDFHRTVNSILPGDKTHYDLAVYLENCLKNVGSQCIKHYW